MHNHYFSQKDFFAKDKAITFGKNALVHWLVIATSIMIILVLVGLLFYVHPSVGMLRLQYNVFFGTSLHAPWWGAYVLVGVGALFFAMDVLVAYILYIARERIAAYAVLLGAFFVQIALLVAAMSIVLNNF